MIYTDRLIIKEEDVKTVAMSDTTLDIVVEGFGNVRIESSNVADLKTTFNKIVVAMKEFEGER